MARPYKQFQVEHDYWIPLLELLRELGEGGALPAQAISAFKARYEDFLGPYEREYVPSGEAARWTVKVQWSRYHLTRLGLIETVERCWRITAEGEAWLEAYPEGTHLNGIRRHHGAAPRSLGAGTTSFLPQDHGISFVVRGVRCRLSGDQVLESARKLLQAGLPAEALRFHGCAVDVDGTLVGARWLVEQTTGADGVRSWQARGVLERLGFRIVSVTGHAVGARSGEGPRAPKTYDGWLPPELVAASREVQVARDVLAGRAERPSDDRLCDLVQFCYTVGMYREAQQLFALVDRPGANAWHYERTAKLARLCRLKCDGQ